MADFIPTPERPVFLSRDQTPQPGDPRWAAWERALDRRQGPPGAVYQENARRLAEAERILFGRVRTRM